MKRPLVTVKTLLAQARERDTLELPADALITPAAREWLRTARLPVRSVAAPAPAHGPTSYFIGDAARADVQTLLPALQARCPELRFLPCNGHMSGLMEALGKVCTGLTESCERRAVVVVSAGASVSCVANKYAGVRAAILTRPGALFDLMHELGVNMLILEREHLSYHQLRAAAETFLTGETRVTPIIAGALRYAAAADSGARADGPVATPPPAPAPCPCSGPR